MSPARSYQAAIIALALLVPALALAEPFHMAHSAFDLTEAHADLVSDRQVRTEPDGSRSILVTRVQLTVDGAGGGRPMIVHSLDQRRLGFDCAAAVYKVLSERLFTGLDDSAPQTDKTPAAPAALPVADDAMRDFQTFACLGPRSVKPPMFGFQQQNQAEAIARVADDLERTLAKLVSTAR